MKAKVVCLGFKLGTAGWKAQTNPMTISLTFLLIECIRPNFMSRPKRRCVKFSHVTNAKSFSSFSCCSFDLKEIFYQLLREREREKVKSNVPNMNNLRCNKRHKNIEIKNGQKCRRRSLYKRIKLEISLYHESHDLIWTFLVEYESTYLINTIINYIISSLGRYPMRIDVWVDYRSHIWYIQLSNYNQFSKSIVSYSTYCKANITFITSDHTFYIANKPL